LDGVIPETPKVISLKTKKIVVRKSSSSSLFDSSENKEGWVKVAEKGTKFKIVSDSFTEDGDPLREKTRLGFASWDDSIKDLDDGASPQSQKLNISSHLKCGDVEVREKIITAPSIVELEKVLSHITFSAWSEGDL